MRGLMVVVFTEALSTRTHESLPPRHIHTLPPMLRVDDTDDGEAKQCIQLSTAGASIATC